MNAQDIIREVAQQAAEYLEMTEYPDAMVSGILAKKIVDLQEYIKYLERRLNNVSSSADFR